MSRLFFFTFLVFFYIHSFAQKKTIFFQVSSYEFNSLVSKDNGVLLDVRTEREYRNGHIGNSGQLNFYSFDFRRRLLLLPKDQPIYVYCNTGYRSEKAAEYLINNGYTQVYNLQHGIMEWELAELPVVVDPNASPETEDKFEIAQFQELIQSDSLVFIDFYAPWCGPCRQMMPMIDSLKVEYHERIQVVKINADASKRLMKDIRLASVPYLVLYRQGQILFDHKGIIGRGELVQAFEHYLKIEHQISQ